PRFGTSSRCVSPEQRRPPDENAFVLPDVRPLRTGLFRRPAALSPPRTGIARHTLHCALGAEAASDSGVRHVFRYGPVQVGGNVLARRNRRLVHFAARRIQALPRPRSGPHAVVFAAGDMVGSGRRSRVPLARLVSPPAPLRAARGGSAASVPGIHGEHSVFPMGCPGALLPVSVLLYGE